MTITFTGPTGTLQALLIFCLIIMGWGIISIVTKSTTFDTDMIDGRSAEERERERFTNRHRNFVFVYHGRTIGVLIFATGLVMAAFCLIGLSPSNWIIHMDPKRAASCVLICGIACIPVIAIAWLFLNNTEK